MTIEQEKKLITIMIEIYEKGHGEDLSTLKEYAYKRIDHCPVKKKKHFVQVVLFIVMLLFIVNKLKWS